jgi:hypothetical protein
MPELAGATKARSRGGAALRPVPDGLSEPGRPTQVAAAALADDEG